MTGLPAATVIGRYVTIGQGCLLRSTTVEDECIIGDKSILLEGSLVEHNSILAPGTVLPPGRLIPSGQLWGGNPARFVRDLSKDEVLLVSLYVLRFTLASSNVVVLLIVVFDFRWSGSGCFSQPGKPNITEISSTSDFHQCPPE